MCERNSIPSFFILFNELSEKIWNPPESVKMFLSQPAKACKPPISSITSSPGRKYK